MSLVADSQGVVLGQFDIPADTIPAGQKLVQFYGAGGSYAQATYIGRGQTTIQDIRQARVRRYNTIRVDPLAQSFTLDTDGEVAGIDVWFANKGTSRIIVQLREMSNGYPTPVALSEAQVDHTPIVTNAWTRIEFDAPVYLQAGREFCIVFMCDNATAALRIATLGDFDEANQKWITSQPWTTGVLFDSSNNSTWTAHNESDIQFRLLAPVYSPLSKVVNLDDVTLVDADYAIIMASIERPTADTDVVFTVQIPTGEIYEAVENAVIVFPSRQNGTMSISATLTGTANTSPKLYPDVQIVSGKTLSPSTYVSRSIPIALDPNNLDSKITIIYEALQPSPSTITVEADVNGTWTAVSTIANGEVPIGDGWLEITKVLDPFDDTYTATALRITLTGTAWARPRARNLRLIAVTT